MVLFVFVFQVSGDWERSASFPVDSVGEYTLRLTRRVDISGVRHISTRRSSEYDVTIPRMEVGTKQRHTRLFNLVIFSELENRGSLVCYLLLFLSNGTTVV